MDFSVVIDFFENLVSGFLSTDFVQGITAFFEGLSSSVSAIMSYPALLKSLWDLVPTDVHYLFVGIISLTAACTIVHGLIRKV